MRVRVAPFIRSLAARLSGHAGTGVPFDRIVYLNLDRRPDRRALIEAQLTLLGWRAMRHAAHDGATEAYRQRLADYLAAHATGAAQARAPGDDHTARVRAIEAGLGRPALRTPGEFAHLDSMAAIVRAANADGIDRLLVLEDDALLHRDAARLLSRLMARLPRDWLFLSLGNLTRVRRRRLPGWSNHRLVPIRSKLIGSHAFALSRPAFVELEELLRRADAPTDDGALSSFALRHPGRAFAIMPPLAVQPLDESDVQPAGRISSAAGKARWEAYGWQRSDYLVPDAVPRQGGAAKASEASEPG